MNNKFETSLGCYKLERIPRPKYQPLQAWDAADEYMLNHLHEAELLSANNGTENLKRILVINDSFGALSISLHPHEVHHWSDSFMAQQGCLQNFLDNKVATKPTITSSMESLEGRFDLILIKIPKTLALLKEQLIALKPHTDEKSIIIGSGMIKHLPKSVVDLFEKVIGPTKTSLAKKKSRLIFSTADHDSKATESDYPKCYSNTEVGLDLCHHANVFSKEKLDIGTRFFIEQFNKLPQMQNIVDLGCGNGLLGIIAQQQHPESNLVFVDESYMAVESAKLNYQKAFPEKSAYFVIGDSLKGYKQPIDLILCNPPFHQQQSTGDLIAWEMFLQSYKKLSPSGELWVVGNRHMDYYIKLKKLFDNCKTVASNKKFVVLAACKQ